VSVSVGGVVFSVSVVCGCDLYLLLIWLSILSIIGLVLVGHAHCEIGGAAGAAVDDGHGH